MAMSSFITMKLAKLAILILTLLGATAFVFPREWFFPRDYVADSDQFLLEVVAKGLVHPWSMVFLPDGRMLVSERTGQLRVVTQQGNISASISGVPEVYARGQGGLLGLALDPHFTKNRKIYFSFSEPEKDLSGTAVASAELTESGLQHVKVIFRQHPKVKGSAHYGSRLVFAPDGTLFITMGDRLDYSEQAQSLSDHLGKVVRINTDGSTPSDNPFVRTEGAQPEIWSYGHRNMQGAALNPVTGVLWTQEHGPRGGDEINIDKAGKNYGWPHACYGSHYSGIDIPDDHASRGFEEPTYYWTPSIAPSGMVFYTGAAFPQWQHTLFVGALGGEQLVRLELDGDKVVREEKLLTNLGTRIRDVVQGPDGFLYLLTDEENGHLLRLVPSQNKVGD